MYCHPTGVYAVAYSRFTFNSKYLFEITEEEDYLRMQYACSGFIANCNGFFKIRHTVGATGSVAQYENTICVCKSFPFMII